MTDEGHAVHYTALARGTPVYSSDGVEVGLVRKVLDNYREHILDGIVMETPDRELRFVDGPEVERTFERAVTLNITAEQAARLPKPEKDLPDFIPDKARTRLSRLLGGGRKG